MSRLRFNVLATHRSELEPKNSMTGRPFSFGRYTTRQAAEDRKAWAEAGPTNKRYTFTIEDADDLPKKATDPTDEGAAEAHTEDEPRGNGGADPAAAPAD